MPNHLTPEELSKELGIDRQEVIRVCVQEGVPIYQGKIDKTLFQAQLQAIGAAHSTPQRSHAGHSPALLASAASCYGRSRVEPPLLLRGRAGAWLAPAPCASSPRRRSS